VPLTLEHDRVRRGLAALREKGPKGRSNLLQGIQRTAVELCATESAISEARPGALRMAYFFTDGNPTLPLDAATPENRRLAIAAAEKAHACGVRIHTYGLGPRDDPSMAEIGRVTRGSYRRLDAAELARRNIPAASLVRLKGIEVENRTTGARAAAIDARLDGSLFALVPMQPGPNQLALIARLGDSESIELLREVQFDPSAPADPPDAVQREAGARLHARPAAASDPAPAGVGSPPEP
jgi:hypothetical protein